MQIRAECPSRRLELTTKGGKERVRRQFFPFELIMAGSAARRAGEPFVQQFLDKHSRAGAAFVGVPLPAAPYSFVALRQHGPTFPGRAPPLLASPSPAKPYFFVTPRQHGPTFPGRTPPLLASPSPLRLIPSPRHANTAREFSDTAREFSDKLAYWGTRK